MKQLFTRLSIALLALLPLTAHAETETVDGTTYYKVTDGRVQLSDIAVTNGDNVTISGNDVTLGGGSYMSAGWTMPTNCGNFAMYSYMVVKFSETIDSKYYRIQFIGTGESQNCEIAFSGDQTVVKLSEVSWLSSLASIRFMNAESTDLTIKFSELYFLTSYASEKEFLTDDTYNQSAIWDKLPLVSDNGTYYFKNEGYDDNSNHYYNAGGGWSFEAQDWTGKYLYVDYPKGQGNPYSEIFIRNTTGTTYVALDGNCGPVALDPSKLAYTEGDVNGNAFDPSTINFIGFKTYSSNNLYVNSIALMSKSDNIAEDEGEGDEETPDQPATEAVAYTFDVNDWCGADRDTDANTMTFANGSESSTRSMYFWLASESYGKYTVEAADYFVVRGTNISSDLSSDNWIGPEMYTFNGTSMGWRHATEVATVGDENMVVWSISDVITETTLLNGETNFGITPADNSQSSTISYIGFLTAAELAIIKAQPYEFVATEWVSGDDGVINSNTFTYGEDNTITATPTSSDNGMRLGFNQNNSSNSKYYFTRDQKYFVVRSTNVNAEGSAQAHYLNTADWMGGVAATAIYAIGDTNESLVVWNAIDITAGNTDYNTADVNIINNWICVGFSPAEVNTACVVSYAGFVTESELTAIVAQPYQFVATEWTTGDSGIMAAEDYTYDTDNNTLTGQLGTANNTTDTSLRLGFNQNNSTNSKYYFTSEQKYFAVRATNLSTGDNHYAHYLNTADWSYGFQPTAVYEIQDEVLVVWEALNVAYRSGDGSAYANTEDVNLINNWFSIQLTRATDTSCTISFAGFLTEDELADAIGAARQYTFACTDWTTGDTGALITDNMVWDEAANTITIKRSEGGYDNCNMSLANYTKYYTTSEKTFFVVTGQNISTNVEACTLWHLDGWVGGTDYAQYAVQDGDQTVVIWDIAASGRKALLDSDKTEFTYNSGFGLSRADGEQDLMLTNIALMSLDEVLATYASALANITVSAGTVTTLCSSFPLDFTDSDVTAYVVSEVSDGAAKLTAVTTAPARTGLILVADEAISIALPIAATAEEVGTNLLVGNVCTKYSTQAATLDGASTEYSYYLLGRNSADEDMAFHLVGSAYTGDNIYRLAQHKAYLPLAKEQSANALTLVFDGEATGIADVQTSRRADEIFDLSGRQVSKATKGIYIVNGKKVLY